MPQDDRLHRQYDNRRQQAEDQDAEQLAETLKQRYRKPIQYTGVRLRPVVLYRKIINAIHQRSINLCY